MTRITLLLAGAAFVLAAGAADAQVLRGGGIGLGSSLGGGLTGSVSTTLERVGGDLDGEAGAAMRDLPRMDRRIKPPKPAGPPTRPAVGHIAFEGRVTATVSGSLDGASRMTRDIRGDIGDDVRDIGSDVRVGAPPVVLGAGALAVPSVEAPAIGGVVVQRRQALIDDGVAFVPYAEAPAYIDRQEAVLDRELAGTGVQVHRRGQQIFIEMPSDVTFAFDKYDIQPRFFPVLSAVARTVNQFPATYVDIVGHTDAIGTYAYNQVLSERRASSVADYLVEEHALSDRFYVEGRGKTEPIASNATIEGRAANRRVEIILTPFEGPA
jgi:outer membrane protein OmpA-like peptidoglycan-associated protein